MALLDDIKNRLQAPVPTLTPAGNSQSAIQSLLGTKATGKAAIGGATPKASNIGEQVAKQTVAQQASQLGQQQQVQAAQLGQEQEQLTTSIESAKQDLAAKRQEQEKNNASQWQMGENARLAQSDESMAKLSQQNQMHLAQLSSSYNQKVKEMASERGIASDDIFAQFTQGNQELADRADAAQLEQLAFNMRFSDNQYLDQLSRVGKVRMLENDLNFRKEAAKLRMGDDMSLFLDQLGWLDGYNDSNRKFSEKMNSLDLDFAMSFSDKAAAAQNKQQIATGIMTGSKAGIEYMVENKKKSTSTPPPKSEVKGG